MKRYVWKLCYKFEGKNLSFLAHHNTPMENKHLENMPTILEYEIGKETHAPENLPIFTFETKKDAVNYTLNLCVNDFVIFRCERKLHKRNRRKSDYMLEWSLSTDPNFLKMAMDFFSSEYLYAYNWSYTPSGTVLCEWVKPIAVEL